jgi:copper chaperone CopZ
MMNRTGNTTSRRTTLLAGACAISLALLTMGVVPATAQVSPPSPGAETITLKIDGWTCRSCEKDIRRALLAVPGVKAADVSYPRGGAIISVEPGRVSPDRLIKAVEGTSTLLSTYRAAVIPHGSLPETGKSEGEAGSFFKRLFR